MRTARAIDLPKNEPEVQAFTASPEPERTPGGIIITGDFPAAQADEPQPIRTWREYSAWRRTKCPYAEFRAAIWKDELDQAIHEFVGESAELAEALLEVGPFVWISQDARSKALDEVGDAIFTGSWVWDLIDPSFLHGRGEITPGFLPPDTREHIAKRHASMLGLDPNDIHNLAKAPDAVQTAVIDWHQELSAALLSLTTNTGALANTFKKARWYRMTFDEQTMAERTFNAFVSLDAIAEMSGISLFSAAHRNIQKLNRRYPDGWKPGGGVRPKP